MLLFRVGEFVVVQDFLNLFSFRLDSSNLLLFKIMFLVVSVSSCTLFQVRCLELVVVQAHVSASCLTLFQVRSFDFVIVVVVQAYFFTSLTLLHVEFLGFVVV